MNWKLHLLAENTAAILPFRRAQRAWSRRHAKPAERMRLLESALERAIQQVELMRKCDSDPTGRTGLEIGTSWHPVNALVQSLAGAQQVYLVHSRMRFEHDSVLSSVYQLTQWSTVLAQRLGVSEEAIERRCASAVGKDVDGIFQSFGLIALSPADATNLELDAGSIDYITSRDELSKVPPATLRKIIAESRRVLRRSGVMCHHIDNSDPWASRDRSISRIHFLSHSDAFWSFCCINQRNYRNRLRHSQYRALFEEAGFEVVHQSKKVDARSLSVVPTLRLVEPFARIPEKDLCAVASVFVLRKAPELPETDSQEMPKESVPSVEATAERR